MPNLSLVSIFDELNFKTPLILIFQRGIDPVYGFLEMVKNFRFTSEQYHIISMG